MVDRRQEETLYEFMSNFEVERDEERGGRYVREEEATKEAEKVEEMVEEDYEVVEDEEMEEGKTEYENTHSLHYGIVSLI